MDFMNNSIYFAILDNNQNVKNQKTQEKDIVNWLYQNKQLKNLKNMF